MMSNNDEWRPFLLFALIYHGITTRTLFIEAWIPILLAKYVERILFIYLRRTDGKTSVTFALCDVNNWF